MDEYIRKFRKPFRLINTSRGPVVKTEDLVKNLESGKITGAALDVLEYEKANLEKISFDSLPQALQYLYQSDKVILTPHIAGWTVDRTCVMQKYLLLRSFQPLVLAVDILSGAYHINFYFCARFT